MTNFITFEINREHDILNTKVRTFLKDLNFYQGSIGHIDNNHENAILIAEAQEILQHLIAIKTLRSVEYVGK